MQKIHFIGIGGIGLSAIARFLKQQGYDVTGSDIKDTKITKKLQHEGIKVTIPHDKSSITDQDFVIYSAVIKNSNVEIMEAQAKGIITLSRRDALPFILKEKKVFSVCGAHGKSTTTAMLASIMEDSALIGAESKQFGTNMILRDGKNLIFEADESDESFLNSNPYMAIITNAEPEHMEQYNHDINLFYKAYTTFLNSAKVRVINAEDNFLSTLKDLDAIRLYPSVDIKNIKTIIKNNEPYTSFNLKNLGNFEVWGSGEHMAIDASLAILAAQCELDILTIKNRLKNFKGIKKRFDILYSDDNHAIIDDYAHHPTEIRATLKSAFEYKTLMDYKRVIAIWQPHKYSRTIDNLDSFVECFKGVNALVILPVYAVNEEEKTIDFKEKFKYYNPIFASCIKKDDYGLTLCLESKDELKLDKDLIIGFGAGDITYQLRGAV